MVWENYNETFFKNLNEHSKHPNPWRPPNYFESYMHIYSPYRLTTPIQPVYTPNKETLISQQPVEMMKKYSWVGIKLGSYLTLLDVALFRPTYCPKQMLARWAYQVPIYGLLPPLYIASRELLGKVASDKDRFWTYWAAVLPPATVWGLYKGRTGSFGTFFVIGALGAVMYKSVNENELLLFMDNESKPYERFTVGLLNPVALRHPQRDDPELGFAKKRSDWANHWRQWANATPLTGANEIEPTWKKYLSEEDQKKGPQQGKY